MIKKVESRVLIDKFNDIVQNKTKVITNCHEALAQREKIRFEKELDAKLCQLDVKGTERMKVPAKKIMTKDTMEENDILEYRHY